MTTALAGGAAIAANNAEPIDTTTAASGSHPDCSPNPTLRTGGFSIYECPKTKFLNVRFGQRVTKNPEDPFSGVKPEVMNEVVSTIKNRGCTNVDVTGFGRFSKGDDFVVDQLFVRTEDPSCIRTYFKTHLRQIIIHAS